MNIQRVCNVKKSYNQISLGGSYPNIADKKNKIIVHKIKGNFYVTCVDSIEFLQKYGFYGKVIDSSNLDIRDTLSDNYLLLSDIEALFLLFVYESLIITCHETNQIISIEDLWRDCIIRNGERFLAIYVAYHYYRSHGWVVRPGLRFGSDYLLYIASPDHTHASYSVCVKQFVKGGFNDFLTEDELLNEVRVSHSVLKHTVFCKVNIDTHHPFTEFAVINDCSVEEVHISRFEPNSKEDCKI